MNAFVFSEKRTITSDFSPIEMIMISRGRSAAEARKYFITKYVVPLVLTTWFQRDEDSHTVANRTCCVRLLPSGAGLTPHLSFENSAASFSKVINDEVQRSQNDPMLNHVFKACPPNLWNEAGASLSEALMSAFAESLPLQWPSEQKEYLRDTPLIASMQRFPVTGGDEVTLNVMVKTRQTVKTDGALLNQAESNASPLVVRASKKYTKTYNMLSGEWVGVCDRDDPDKCDLCKAIFASPAANNVYDDPQFS